MRREGYKLVPCIALNSAQLFLLGANTKISIPCMHHLFQCTTRRPNAHYWTDVLVTLLTAAHRTLQLGV